MTNNIKLINKFKEDNVFYLLKSDLNNSNNLFDSFNYITANYQEDSKRGFLFNSSSNRLLSKYIEKKIGNKNIIFEFSMSIDSRDSNFDFEIMINNGNDSDFHNIGMKFSAENINQLFIKNTDLSVNRTINQNNFNIDKMDNSNSIKNWSDIISNKNIYRIILTKDRRAIFQIYNLYINDWTSFHYFKVDNNYKYPGSQFQIDINYLGAIGNVYIDNLLIYEYSYCKLNLNNTIRGKKQFHFGEQTILTGIYSDFLIIRAAIDPQSLIVKLNELSIISDGRRYRVDIYRGNSSDREVVFSPGLISEVTVGRLRFLSSPIITTNNSEPIYSRCIDRNDYIIDLNKYINGHELIQNNNEIILIKIDNQDAGSNNYYWSFNWEEYGE